VYPRLHFIRGPPKGKGLFAQGLCTNSPLFFADMWAGSSVEEQRTLTPQRVGPNPTRPTKHPEVSRNNAKKAREIFVFPLTTASACCI
jgi:hypothetical protein